jgi:DNA-directed RNA polymerase specialized sigma24 family protein
MVFAGKVPLQGHVHGLRPNIATGGGDWPDREQNPWMQGRVAMTDQKLLQQYEGAFQAWKAKLAINRIKALGFPRRDWPDLMQDLAVVILEFRYDPDHDNGATEQTVLYAVINRHLLHRMRSRYRDRERFAEYLRSLGVHDDGSYLGPDPCIETDYGLGLDVERALAGLSPFDRAIAGGLAAGLSQAAVARALGCEWNTVHKAVERVGRCFRRLGLDGEGSR